MADTWLLYSGGATKGRRRTVEGTVIFWPHARPCTFVLFNTDPRTKVTRPALRWLLWCAEHIFIPKVRIVSLAATTCTKGSIARCRVPVPLFVFFIFEGREGRQKHYKTQFPGWLLERFFVANEKWGWPNAGRSMRFRVNINRPPCEHKREGIVSISDAKRLPRN